MLDSLAAGPTSFAIKEAPAISRSVRFSDLIDFSGALPPEKLPKEFQPDFDYERQEGVREALSAVRSGAPVVFISGRAGTGKSRLIEYMRHMPGGERQVIVAPTGVAALSLRAATIHSMFRLPLGVIDAEAMIRDERFGKAVRRMRRLVIDEVSMVRGDILDGIDRRLRDLRNPDRPFGGVQVILVGDFLQLPPVVTDQDRDLLDRLGYATPFAFSARVLANTPVRVATLRKVWRQSDQEMIQVLGHIREGREIEKCVSWLNARCVREHRTSATPVMLTATRASADAYNQEGMEKLTAEQKKGAVTFLADAVGAFENERTVLPAPRELVLMPGARVMAVRNDPAGDYVNGSLGKVIGINEGDSKEEDEVLVRFDWSGKTVSIGRTDWTKTQQVWDDEEEAITERIVGVYTQIPLVIGYALTIHKSQGLSLDDVRIDLGRGAFAPGQLYVALSRARSVEGLSFARPISKSDIQVDEMLVAFLDWVRSGASLSFEAVSAASFKLDPPTSG